MKLYVRNPEMLGEIHISHPITDLGKANPEKAPSFLVDSLGVVLWASEEGKRFLEKFSPSENIEPLFFPKDFDKIRRFSISEPTSFPAFLPELYGTHLLLTPLPEERYLVQVMTNYLSDLVYATNSRIRENLQQMIPTLSYLSSKLGDTEASQDDIENALNFLTRETLQIEQVLTLFRQLTTPAADERNRTIDLCALLLSICPSVYSVTSHLNRNFHWQVPKHAIPVAGSETLLTTVVLSLLSNAFEYTEEGDEIFLYLSTKNDHAIVAIVDTGPGIPENERNTIFDPLFFPENRVYAPKLHLGIPTTRKIVDALGGTLMISSLEESGTSIVLSLPLLEFPDTFSLYQNPEDYLSDRHSPIYRFFSKLPIHPYY